MKKVAIIGCGISGVAAAYYLNKAGFDVEIYEAESGFGGRVGSEIVNGRSLDFGGKNIGYNYELFREFVADQGDFKYEYFGVNTSKVVAGKLVPVNREKNIKSLFSLLKLANILDLAKIFLLVKATKKNRINGFLNSNLFNRISQKKDHKTLDKYFSPRCSQNILRAMTVRMNGAEPDECYFGNFGTNIATAFDKYEQIIGGMDPVIRKFLSKVQVHYNKTVKNILVKDSNIHGIEVEEKDGSRKVVEYDYVISSLPADKIRNLLQNIIPKAAQSLTKIKYFPVTTLIVKYRQPVFNRDVRAVIFEPEVPLSNAGAYGINDLNLVRYTFSGRAARKIINHETSKTELLEIINRVMPREFNVVDNEVLEASVKFYNQGLCAYSQFHYQNLQNIFSELRKIKGLYLCGDYLRGASIEACFRSAKDAVDILISSQK